MYLMIDLMVFEVVDEIECGCCRWMMLSLVGGWLDSVRMMEEESGWGYVVFRRIG